MAAKKENGFLLHIGLFWLRILMGAGIAYHGYGKLFGGQLEMLTQGLTSMGILYPVYFAWAAALSEFLGGIFVAFGVLTRFSALLVFATMGVAAFVAHASDPFLKKELALAYWTMSGMLILTGGGNISVDKLIKK